MFTSKAVVEETHVRKSTKVCKHTVGIDACQLYPCSICQPMPTIFCTRYEFNANLQSFKPLLNKSRSLENMVMSYFQRMGPDCRNEGFYRTRSHEKIHCFNVDKFCRHCNIVFKLFLSYLHLSRGTTCCNAGRHPAWNKRKGHGWNAKQYIEKGGYAFWRN